MSYYYKNRSETAEKKLKKVLSTPERREQERQFAADHAADSDEQLIAYVRSEKEKDKNFKRVHLIGYTYLMERFGSWEKVISAVNRNFDDCET